MFPYRKKGQVSHDMLILQTCSCGLYYDSVPDVIFQLEILKLASDHIEWDQKLVVRLSYLTFSRMIHNAWLTSSSYIWDKKDHFFR